jgi:hypothetical protein
MENLKVMQWVSNAVLVAVVVLAVAVLSGCSTTYSRTPIMSDDGGETAVAYATAIKFGLGNKESTSLGKYKLSADGGLDMEGYGNQQDSSVAFVEGLKLGAVYAGQRGVVIGQGSEPVAQSAVPAKTENVSTVRLAASASGVLSDKVAAAKSNKKTLVVVAGSPQCGYCTRFEDVVNASTLPSRSDIVLVREIVPWESNSALSWTGGGDAPIVRVTSWNDDGSIACDKKLNRPTVADVESAIGACVVK